MQTIDDTTFWAPARVFLVQIGEFLPRALLAILIVIVGWLLAKALRFAVVKALRAVNFHVLTQRVTDWFDSRIGRTIQSVAASKWFGQMEARELYEIAPSLGISPEERDRIEKAGQGEGLLVTTGRRVWVNLYGHTSPGEFAMANTDILADGEHDERRNGHGLATLVGPARR